MDLSAITYSVFIPLLNFLHDSLKSIGLSSFGWSIVALTAIVKLILTPLTFKQIKSTKQMQIVQPKLKKLQEEFKKKEQKYTNDPKKKQEAQMEFQKQMMGFYKEHQINPLGGCLPMLLQMPILLGLFWTFSGAPFKTKPIFVDVKVVQASEASKKQIKPAGNGEIFVDADGRRARIATNTKGLTLIEGESFIAETFKITGDAEPNPKDISWGFFGAKDSTSVKIIDNHDGTATITAVGPGSAKVQALLPSTVEGDHFFFIEDFGNTGVYDGEKGKINYDILILVLLFGISIWASGKLNAPPKPNLKPGEVEDPQMAMQRSMQTMMPIMFTGMMLFIPLPAGAFLYMVVSSFIQAGQTYFAMQRYNKKFGIA